MVVKSSKWEIKNTTAKAMTPRLFFLSVSSGHVFSVNPDGSDLKVIVSEGRRLPDGIVVDADAGHLYWTNMGNPSANDGSIERADFMEKTLSTLFLRAAPSLPSNCNSTRRTASSTGAIVKGCVSCVPTWMVPRSKR